MAVVERIYQGVPSDAAKILLVLFLSFLIGLEREEHKSDSAHFVFGGVRAFPLIGLIGYSMAVLSGAQLIPLAIGFGVIGAFLVVSYWRKLSASGVAGVTSEMSGLATYIVGALVYYDHFWLATALGVASALLLELKAGLESLTHRIAPEEILTFTKFLLLSAVILPILPNAEFGPFQINPFKTWLVVVAVSGVSFGSYALQRVTKDKGGVTLAAILGGAYSSTIATVAIAKRASHESKPHLYSGGILMASGMMYLRLAVLLGFFNHALMTTLAPAFIVLACLAVGAGWGWSRMGDDGAQQIKREFQPRNPLELRAAFIFAVLFLAMVIATHYVTVHMGQAGVYALAAGMGITDVDPFILGMTQAAGSVTPIQVASAGIVIAASSNNVVKGIYAYTMADRKTGQLSLFLLGGLALLGLAPLLWLIG